MPVKKAPESTASDESITKTIDGLIEKAVLRQATDMHIEPRDRNIVVRFRIDGSLYEIAKLPSDSLGGLLNNLKKRAGLDVKESRRPQNGSFCFKSRQYDVTLQIATMPTIDGEKISIHLNPELSDPATLESLGYWGDLLRTIELAVVDPHGLIIVASPDRTGASLSLLGIAHLLSNPALNIVTLEDPISHRLHGINQTQLDVRSGIDFGTGLQALLKQDANVVVVSDMHESKTAQLALEASLGGQLLLGGLYVGSAAHAITHLARVRGEPYMVASALKLALGQRFVRHLCPACREVYKPDEDDLSDVKGLLKSYDITSFKRIHTLETRAAKEGLGGHQSVESTERSLGQLWRARDGGCPDCNFSGYVGRVGANEVLINSDDIKELIAQNASAAIIQKKAIEGGMVPMQIDGLIKALRGLTTLEAILALGAP